MKTIKDLRLEYKQDTGKDPEYDGEVTGHYLEWLEGKVLLTLNAEDLFKSSQLISDTEG